MKKIFCLVTFFILGCGFSPLLSASRIKYDEKKIYRLLEVGDFSGFRNEIARLEDASVRKFFEGVAAVYQGDYRSAREILNTIRFRDENKSENFYAVYSGYMASIAAGFKEKNSEHFILRYFPSDEVMADYALLSLEKIRLGASLLFGWSPDGKVLVEIYPDKKSFAVASTLGEEILEKSGTVGICKFNRIMILSPRNLALGYRWVETLAHEYTHFVINRITRYNCPLWVHEGIARWSDTVLIKVSSHDEAGENIKVPSSLYLSDFSLNLLSQALSRRGLIPFEKMQNSLVYLPTPDDISLAFLEVADFVDFLVSGYGAGKLRGWLNEMRFSDEKKSFGRVFGVSLESVKNRWFRQISSKYRRPQEKDDDKKRPTSGVPDLPLYGVKSDEDLMTDEMTRYTRLGDELRRRGNFEAAYEQYLKAWDAGKTRRSPVVAVKMSRALIAMGRHNDAKSLMESVIAGNRSYITPYVVLYEVTQVEKNETEAGRYLKEIFEINPFYPGVYEAIFTLDR